MVGDEAGRAFPGRDMARLSGEAGLFCSNEELSSQGLRAMCRLAGSCHLERGGHCACPTTSMCSLEQPQDAAAHSSLSCGHSPPALPLPSMQVFLEVESWPPHTGIIPCISFRASFSEFACIIGAPGTYAAPYYEGHPATLLVVPEKVSQSLCVRVCNCFMLLRPHSLFCQPPWGPLKVFLL